MSILYKIISQVLPVSSINSLFLNRFISLLTFLSPVLRIKNRRKRKKRREKWVTWTVFGWRPPWLWRRVTPILATSARRRSTPSTTTVAASSPAELCRIFAPCPASWDLTAPALWRGALTWRKGWLKRTSLCEKWCTWVAGARAEPCVALTTVEIKVVPGNGGPALVFGSGSVLSWPDRVRGDDSGWREELGMMRSCKWRSYVCVQKITGFSHSQSGWWWWDLNLLIRIPKIIQTLLPFYHHQLWV